jgi:hypothetical protein
MYFGTENLLLKRLTPLKMFPAIPTNINALSGAVKAYSIPKCHLVLYGNIQTG